MIKQRNYYNKYKSYYWYLSFSVIFGVTSISYLAYKLFKYLYIRRIHEENEIANIRSTWVYKLTNKRAIFINLILLDIISLRQLLSTIDDYFEKLKIKEKIELIVIINYDSDICKEDLDYAKDLNIILLNLKVNNIEKIDTLSSYVSYFLINLGMSIPLAQYAINKNESILKEKLLLNFILVNKVSSLFSSKNYKKSCVITIETDNFLNLFNIINSIDSIFSSELASYYSNSFKEIESNHRLTIIFKSWEVQKLNLPFKNIISKFNPLFSLLPKIKINKEKITDIEVNRSTDKYKKEIWELVLSETSLSLKNIFGKYII